MLGPIFMGVSHCIPEDCHLCTEISKRRTIMQATAWGHLKYVENYYGSPNRKLHNCAPLSQSPDRPAFKVSL